MVGCFAIRKLLDTPGRVSDECRSSAISVTIHEHVGTLPDFWNAHEIDKLYDLSNSTTQTMSIRELCNRIIHSLIFMFVFGEHHRPRQMEGLFVASDTSSRSSLTFIPTSELLWMFRVVSEDEVVRLSMMRDAQGKMNVTKTSRHNSSDTANGT
jgi:hypothetical protein